MKQAAEIVSVLFLSREQAHRAHLLTKSYEQHVALGSFYEAAIDLADSFAELYQGTYGRMDDIPYGTPLTGAIDAVLEKHLDKLEDLRTAFGKKICDRPLENVLDEICGLYATTLYKLRLLQ